MHENKISSKRLLFSQQQKLLQNSIENSQLSIKSAQNIKQNEIINKIRMPENKRSFDNFLLENRIKKIA